MTNINVNFLDFIKIGKFDFIKINDTKEYILHNFFTPDDFGGGKTMHDANIWRYGNIEFHFSDNRLAMIFCDYMDCIDGGSKIELDKWFFEDAAYVTLEDVICELNRKRIDFKLNHNQDIKLVELQITQSHVNFVFSDNDGCIFDCNYYTISHIYLK